MQREVSENIRTLLREKYGIIGSSRSLGKAIEMLSQAAPTDLTVLINGETGTGKEIFANAVHGLSKRSGKQFISVNCGAIPETLLESELFGHEKGAFTGATDQRKGFFETADRGTIFLDEIGEMPIGTQVKLLRVLESGEFSRLGSSSVHKVDVRVIAATNRDLRKEVRDGNFRQDLYFRLKSVQITLPPLRDHPEDIPELCEYFGKRAAMRQGFDFNGFDREAMRILQSLSWPGNVRELKNLVETAVTLEDGKKISPDNLKKYLPPALPEWKANDLPAEQSIVHLPEEPDTRGMELGLIFRTLLKMENEMRELFTKVSKIERDVEYIREETESQVTEYNIIEEDEEKFDFSNELNLATLEKEAISVALKRFSGNRRQAAEALGISERTLYRKISDYGII